MTTLKEIKSTHYQIYLHFLRDKSFKLGFLMPEICFMFDKVANLFKSSQQRAEEAYVQAHKIVFDEKNGYSIDGVVLNEVWGERLEYFSNRKLKNFDDLNALFYKAILINEKIDLEIASGRYVARLGNNQENLQELKQIIQQLNHYYKEFKREK